MVNDFYAGAWEPVHYLHAGHLTGGRERFGQMQNYLAALQRRADGEEAFGQAFDISPLELQREVEQYIERGRIPRLEYPAQAFEWREDAQVNTLHRAEVAYELGYLAVLVNPDVARALFEDVLPSLSADSPLRARTLAGIEVTHQFEENFHLGFEIGRQAVAKAEAMLCPGSSSPTSSWRGVCRIRRRRTASVVRSRGSRSGDRSHTDVTAPTPT